MRNLSKKKRMESIQDSPDRSSSHSEGWEDGGWMKPARFGDQQDVTVLTASGVGRWTGERFTLLSPGIAVERRLWVEETRGASPVEMLLHPTELTPLIS
jgi:hypothetical protein